MTDFAIVDDGGSYRLVKWDGSSRSNIKTWQTRPDVEMLLNGVMDYHNVGNSPFSSRQATIDSLLVISKHIPVIDRDAGHPWPWQ